QTCALPISDVVLINTIVLSVYSVFPGATTVLNSYQNYCHQQIVDIEYIVANYKGNHPLKAKTPIACYIDDELIATAETEVEIGMDQQAVANITLNIPKKFGYRFDLVVSVDDTGNKKGIVYEIDEENNISQMHINLVRDCPIQKGVSANFDGFNDGFDLSVYQPNELRIYNRYGTEVFTFGNGYTNQWVGQDKNGRTLPTGTYYYVFTTRFESFSGYVYLIYELYL